jgi:hypothetical protein
MAGTEILQERFSVPGQNPFLFLFLALRFSRSSNVEPRS